MNYVVTTEKYKEGRFEELFELNREYTEHEIIQKLADRFLPERIEKGRRTLYGQISMKDMNGRDLYRLVQVYIAHHTSKGDIILNGIYVDGYALALSHNGCLVITDLYKDESETTKQVVRAEHICNDFEVRTILEKAKDSKELPEETREVLRANYEVFKCSE